MWNLPSPEPLISLGFRMGWKIKNHTCSPYQFSPKSMVCFCVHSFRVSKRAGVTTEEQRGRSDSRFLWGCCKMRVLQQPLAMGKNEQKSLESVGKYHKSHSFLHSNADPGLKTSAECGKPAPFSVMQPKSRINAFAIGLCPVSSRSFSGQKRALKRKALYGCSSFPV